MMSKCGSVPILLFGLAVALLVSASTASASMIYLDKNSQGQGNKGAVYRPSDGMGGFVNFVLTARSSVDSTQAFVADAAGLPGTVVIDKKGAGVQTSGGGGSKGISGGGGHKDEELIFSYDEPVFLNSILLGLNDIEFGSGLGDKDDPIIFLSIGGSGSFDVIVSESEVFAAFSSSGKKTGLLDFSGFTSLAGDTPIVAFKIRETNGHIFVGSSSTAVVIPEPSLCLLMIAGALFLVRRRRLRQHPGCVYH